MTLCCVRLESNNQNKIVKIGSFYKSLYAKWPYSVIATVIYRLPCHVRLHCRYTTWMTFSNVINPFGVVCVSSALCSPSIMKVRTYYFIWLWWVRGYFELKGIYKWFNLVLAFQEEWVKMLTALWISTVQFAFQNLGIRQQLNEDTSLSLHSLFLKRHFLIHFDTIPIHSSG